ncbi:MAG: geranylgeranyl reductase family protein [Bacteroidetes bacterium]|nr:geranylgeranyl reductase family protein [Bacteroidota bacterium]
MNSSTTYFDVIISGAGPAGTACALALKQVGLKVALIDKAEFPRDKVCGDAIGSRAARVLKNIDPKLADELEAFPQKSKSSGWKLVAPNGKEVKLLFVNYGYVSAREHFDNFLLNLVRKHTSTTIMTGVKITSVNYSESGVDVNLENGSKLNCKMIVGCDGAHSIVRKLAGDFKVDPANYSGAVRAYFDNVIDIEEEIIEIHLGKNFLPGYFWIFPLPNNACNVGFGMLSSEISKRRIDIKKSFYDFIEQHPNLKARFANAKQVGELKGLVCHSVVRIICSPPKMFCFAATRHLLLTR